MGALLPPRVHRERWRFQLNFFDVGHSVFFFYHRDFTLFGVGQRDMPVTQEEGAAGQPVNILLFFIMFFKKANLTLFDSEPGFGLARINKCF